MLTLPGSTPTAPLMPAPEPSVAAPVAVVPQHGCPRPPIAALLALALLMISCSALFAASNCGVFVAPTGSDVATCGTSNGSPCRTIGKGVARAAETGASCVFVQAGTYNEILVPSAGIELLGGFDTGWQPGPWSDPSHRVTVIGGQDNGGGGSGEYLTVRVHGPASPVLIQEMVLQGPNAVGSVGGNGRSASVVHVSAAALTLVRVRIEAGAGAAGASGVAGLDAVIPAAQSYMNGANGGDGAEYVTVCDASSRGGDGPRGTNSCTSSPSSRVMNGGSAGAGGTMDTNCGILSLDLDATNGRPGQNAGFTSGSFGLGGAGGLANAVVGGIAGTPGFVANGGAGTGGGNGSFVSGYWYSGSGNSGGTGENGSGGGGGGGGGGDDVGTDAYGAGGGGGGAGGCAARGGGGGGGGGGGSFGVVAVNASSVSLVDCDIVRGLGGAGRPGGSGGRGQSGGLGGSAGAHPGTAGAGAGGAGVHGGHGGGGGGGAGGHSAAILQSSGSSITQSGLTVSGGSGGPGGTGGISAPAAPVSERDGNSGPAGLSGALGVVRVEPGAEPPLTSAARTAMVLGSVVCDVASCLVDVPTGTALPRELAFAGMSPNPSQRGGEIHFALPMSARVQLDVFDPGGRRLLKLCDRVFAAGRYAEAWNGTGADGRPVPAGVYVIRFEALGRVLSSRATLIP